MKRTILFIVAFLLLNKIFGQTFNITNNPTFDSVVVIPNNATNNDSISFIVYISNEIPGRVFFKVCDSLGNCTTNAKISNDTIYIYETSMEPFSDTTDKFIDTVSLGKLSLSQYTVLLINVVQSNMWPTPPPSFIDTAIFTLSIILSLPDDKNKVEYLMVYPTPSKEKLFVALKSNKKQINDISLFDLTGKQVLAKNNIIPEKTIEINIKNLEKGIYFIKITTNDNSTYIDKIIKM